MKDTKDLVFKIASEPWEFEAIHSLNYRTFVEEIPQHTGNKSHRLVDKFHHQNTYVVCVRDHALLGMLAIHDKRPFSLDKKLEELDSFLPDYTSICEIRLLTIEKKHRKTAIFTGILKKVFFLALERGYDLAVISGATRQLKLYKHIGLQPFGPLVGKKNAQYQPMYFTFDHAMDLKQQSPIFRDRDNRDSFIINALPGSVVPTGKE